MTWTTLCSPWDTASWMESRTGWLRTHGPPTGATTATSSCLWRTTTVESPRMLHLSHWCRAQQIQHKRVNKQEGLGFVFFFFKEQMPLLWRLLPFVRYFFFQAMALKLFCSQVLRLRLINKSNHKLCFFFLTHFLQVYCWSRINIAQLVGLYKVHFKCLYLNYVFFCCLFFLFKAIQSDCQSTLCDISG